LVRAILTRHDQTQIDHVNDEPACVEAQVLDGRRTVCRDVEVNEEGTSANPCLTVRFVSFANETVQLRLQAASRPDASRGGLTDPGGHAPTSSLPLMWRGKSCLAGSGTTVMIDEVAYDIEERIRSPLGFVGLNGFYTDTHQMGAMRASTRALEVMQEPARIGLGSTWIYARHDGSETHCVVTEMPSAEQVVVDTRCGHHSERVLAQIDGRCLRLMKVERLGPDGTGPGFALRFLAGHRFAMDVAGHHELVTGRFSSTRDAHRDMVIELLPQEPSWACARKVKVQIHRLGKNVKVTSSIG
jgi:hypothetical protein